MNSPKINSTKWIYRDGDVRSDYEVGSHVTFKWHRRWQILKTELQHTATHVRTAIKLRKVSDR